MVSESDCLDDEQLASYADGLAAGPRRAAIEAHLGRCDLCSEALAHFARGLEAGQEPSGAPETERYRVERLIGRGSMGSVYRAHDRVLDRTIALKFLLQSPRERAAGDEGALLSEAKALARLTHPNVVAVHELGVLDGQSFTAMEFVDGRTLGEWLDDEDASWRQIVDVLLQAARGLLAAHQADVIHRDVKPSNILVGRDGRVRVVDFGLARGSGAAEPVAAGSAETRPFVTSLAGTPAYMAPELRRQQPATALSDQYSFCLTAYEALFGHRPGDTRPPKRAVPRPIAAVLKRGLSEDPEARYPDMGALLADLEHARRPRQRRVVVAAVAGTLVAAAAALVWTHGSDSQPACSGGREALESVWNDAERDQLAAHLGQRIGADAAARDLIAVIDAQAATWLEVHQEACRATRVLHLQSDAMLDRRMLCLERRLSALDTLLADLRADELPPLEQAWSVAGSIMGQDACASSQALVDLAPLPTRPDERQAVSQAFDTAARIGTWLDLGRLERAEAALADLEPGLDYPPLRAELGFLRGRALAEEGELPEARQALHRALDQAEAGGDVRLKHLIALKLSDVESRRGEFAEAQRWLHQAQASAARIGLQDDPSYAADLALHQGALAWRAGRYEDALARFQEALDGANGASPPPLPSRIAIRFDLGTIHRTLGQLEPAKEHTQAALRLAEDSFGKDHLLSAEPHFGSGLNLLAEQKPAEALAHFERAAAIWRRELGESHAKVGQARTNVGIAHLLMGQTEEAERELQAALAIAEKQPEPDPGQMATVLGNLAALAYARQDFQAVSEHAAKSVAILEPELGSEHPELGQPLLMLGLARTELGDLGGAREALARSLRVQEAALGAEHPSLAYPVNALADIALRQERFADAAKLLERVLQLSAGDDYIAAAASLGLSQALWHGERDRQRARRLARAAGERLARSGRADPDMAKRIDTWGRSIGVRGD